WSVLFPDETVFFFQAEDGIRDGHVTGVQTCALPISSGTGRGSPGCGAVRRGTPPRPTASRPRAPGDAESGRAVGTQPGQDDGRRSEERRVGKECRSRWSP